MSALQPSTVTQQQSVLVICGFRSKPHKLETHVSPISEAVDEVTVLWLNDAIHGDDIRYEEVAISQIGIVNLAVMFWSALVLSRTDEYDVIVSFSLIPYGIFALIAGVLSNTPAHLGIIGSDLDVHEQAWYGPGIRWLFRRFDIITVAGTNFRDRLIDVGVDPHRVHTVSHPVDGKFSSGKIHDSPQYDILWLAEITEAKDPLLFIETVAEVIDRGMKLTVAMVGDGPLRSAVEDAIHRHELEEIIDYPGWSKSPIEYYQNASVFIMTSQREMLPLSLIEAMSVGVPPIVPPLGAIPDVVEHEYNGLIIEHRTPEAFADGIERLIRDNQLRHRLGENAQCIENDHGFEPVAQRWSEILATGQD